MGSRALKREREQKWGTGRFFSSSIPQRDKLWVLSIQTVECVTRGNVAVGVISLGNSISYHRVAHFLTKTVLPFL